MQKFWSLVVLSLLVLPGSLSAQQRAQITQRIDPGQVHPLANHLPIWANATNAAELVPQDQMLNQVTLVLSRPADQQAALEKLLTDQQDPSAPQYHQWLTPEEVGARFGYSDEDIRTISDWLQSQGLQVNWVAPSRVFVSFRGTAADVSRAFQTQLRYFNVNGVRRMSIATAPNVPAALAAAIQAIRGLSDVEDHPDIQIRTSSSDAPQLTGSNGTHYISPQDFSTIYHSGSGGFGATVGIVGRSRINFADLSNFASLSGISWNNPFEVIPTSFGGVDPGPAYTTPPGGSVSIADQGEATLDVLRVASVAVGARVLLVVATSASGGIDAAAQYLVHTSPVPAQVMSISFGSCELKAGQAGVTYWDTLFSAAAAEGISVFVSSGDSGAAGCDADFTAPPSNPSAISPNYICSSSYATCVGGTTLIDTANPSLYWLSSGVNSARGYIPEGAWNEPLNSSSSPQVAGSGGGVSAYVATPSWQVGTGVPSARAGRYTPDISFSASSHDAYLGCFAAAGAGCVTNGSGQLTFTAFSGTSASAPDMAGVAALLIGSTGGKAQGNLNPLLYSIAANVPSVFHDITPASSGVTGCDAAVPSLCNNSVPGEAGYPLTAGYDEVTGLGSLDIAAFLTAVPSANMTEFFATPSSVEGGATVNLNVQLDRGAPTGGATISITSSAAATVPNTSLTIAANQTNNAVAVTAAAVSAATSVTMTANYNGSSKQTTVTVKPPTLAGFNATPTLMTPGDTTAVLVELSSIAPTAGAVVSLTSSNPAVLPVPASVTVAAGQTTMSLNVVAGNVTASTPVTITANYQGGSLQKVVTVAPMIAPVITFSVPSHVYGDPPFTVSATSNSSGVLTYSVNSGPATIVGSTVTVTGIGTVVLRVDQAATSKYLAASATASFVVAGKPQTISLDPLPTSVNYGSAPITIGASASSGLPVTLIVTGNGSIQGSVLSFTNPGSVVVTASQSGNSVYAAAPIVQQFISVNKAVPSVTLTAPNAVIRGGTITLTATVTSPVGSPSGTVTFFDGSTQLGFASLSTGSATMAFSSSSAGAHVLTASYSGDNLNLGATSAGVSVAVEDFSLSASGGTTSQTISRGGTATYSLPVVPVGGSVIPVAVSFTASGQPSGAVVTFNPVTVAAGSGATNVTMTVQVPQTAQLRQQSRSTLALAGLVLLLPLAGWAQAGKRRQRLLAIAVVCSLGLLGLAGCGSGAAGGITQPQATNYSLQVTATAGAVSHSTVVTLSVQQ